MSMRESRRVKIYAELWERHGKKDKRFNESIEKRSANLALGNIQFNAEYVINGEVIEFIPAFIDRYRQGENIKRSIGVIPEWNDWEEDDEELLSLEPEDEKERKNVRNYKPLGPVGYKFKTDILKLIFPREKLDEKFGHDELSSQKEIIKNYMGFLYSFQSSHALAVVTELEVELGDIGFTWEITPDSLISYLYDAFEGGSGITKKIFRDWMGRDNIIRTKIHRILFPPEEEYCCHRCCEKCILLPRTPEFLLSADLLNKDYVRVLFA